MSGRGYLKLIERLKALGWTVELHYLALPDVTVSKQRVAERVAHGGHNIPVSDIERRFPRSLHNLLHSYRMVVDICICRISGTAEVSLVFEQSGMNVTIFDQAAYEYLERQADADR